MVWPGTFSGSSGRQKIRSHFRSSLRFFRQACESDMAEFFSTSQILCNLAICKISSTASLVTPQAESIEMVQYMQSAVSHSRNLLIEFVHLKFVVVCPGLSPLVNDCERSEQSLNHGKYIIIPIDSIFI